MKKSRILFVSGLSALLLSGCFSQTRSLSQPTEVPTSEPGTSSTTGPSSNSQDQPTSVVPTPTSSSTSVLPPDTSSTSAEPQHEHTFEVGYHYDETHHWHNSTCGHDVVSGYEPHSFTSVVTQPTYESQGFTTYSCTKCDYSYVGDYVSPKSHTYATEWSHDGTYHWHACLDDGYTHLKGDQALHEYNIFVRRVDPTFESQGYDVYACECGVETHLNQTDPLEHHYSSEWSHDETEHWHECTDVGYEGKEHGSDRGAHNYIESVVNPILDRDGYTLHQCECGVSYKDNYVSGDYTSIYDINCQRGETGKVKTFGMVTRYYAINSYWNYIVQGDDRYGHESGILVYGYESSYGTPDFGPGDFVEIEGIPSMYNNQIQFNCTNASSEVTMRLINNSFNYSPSVAELTNDMVTSDVTSDEWGYLEQIGQVQVSTHITLPSNEINTTTKSFKTYYGDNRATFFFMGDEVDNIRSLINGHLGEEATISGVIAAYSANRNDVEHSYDSSSHTRINIYTMDNISIGSDPTRVSSVELSYESLHLDVNQQEQLTATIHPDTAVNKSVSWYSGNDSIATVDNTGLVKGISEGRTTIYCRTLDGSKMATCTVTVGDVIDLDELTQISFTSIGSGTYDTNTSIVTKNGIKYGSYRWTSSGSGDLGMFYAHTNRHEAEPDGSFDGAFYNIDPLPELKAIRINYKSSGQLKVSYGDSREYSKTSMLPVHSSFSEEILELKGGSYNYFMIETQDYNLYLNSLSIYHNGETGSPVTAAVQIATQQRIAPITYSGAKVSGTSTVTVPTAYSVVGNTYTVTASKTYTYYSFSDVKDIYDADPSSFDPSLYALTDPTDVANYYIAFGEIPVNYGTKTGSGSGVVISKTCGTVTQVNSMFNNGSTKYARMVQEYNGTYGYARSVPTDTSDSNFKYFEFDIAGFDNYTTSNRDVSRVVIFDIGFTTYANGIPVACITRDHYACFQEYLGAGIWGLPFNANNSTDVVRYNRYYGSVTTLQPAA